MGSCRLCGDVTRWASRLCEECVADLGDCDAVPPRAGDRVKTILLVLGCVAVPVGGWIAWQLSSMP